MSKKTTVSGILLVLLVLATTPLLGTDNVSFLKWWLMTLVLGIGFYPAAAALFPRFHDRGWMFSKVLGIVVSGFAGAGKGTIIKELLKTHDNYALSVSATTRKPRAGEKEGIDYFFRNIPAVTKKIGHYRWSRQFPCDILYNINFRN